jgi:tRNA(His) guanylyltransferase
MSRFLQSMSKFEQDLEVVAPDDVKFLIFRFDGKNFGTYTAGMDFPEDSGFMARMDAAALKICNNIAGAVGAYVVSDEVSLIIRPDKLGKFTYGGRINKIMTIGASYCSAVLTATDPDNLAMFDGKPRFAYSEEDVIDYLSYRYASGAKNAVSMATSAYFPHEKVMGLSREERVELLRNKGIEFDDEYSEGFRHGRFVRREEVVRESNYTLPDGTSGRGVAQSFRWVSNPAVSDFRNQSLDQIFG